MRRSNRNINNPTPLPSGKTQAFELLKIERFKSRPLEPKWGSNTQPYRRICLSNAPPKEQSSSPPVVFNKACVHLRYAERHQFKIESCLRGTLYALRTRNIY